MALKGYAGIILEVDLHTAVIMKKTLDTGLARKYIGGRGFVAKALWDRLLPQVDPLSPDNIFIVATGVLTGHIGPSPNRVIFGAKSPLTGGYGDSAMGGYFSSELKRAGYDYILFTGRSPNPVYLFVEDERVEVRDASEYWGMGAVQVETVLKKELGDKYQVAAIGPAGENLVKFACITHHRGRNAGRTGIGAVMGSKNLKAIVVRGTRTIDVADRRLLEELNRKAVDEMVSHPFYGEFKKYGTNTVISLCNETGVLPNRNFRCGVYRSVDRIDGEAQRNTAYLRDLTCWGCPLFCFMEVKLEKYGGVTAHFAEYETTAMIGSNLELKDVEDLLYANHLCNEYGLDTISTGSVIAFATECFQKDIISREEMGGLTLEYGDPDLLFTLIKMIANREGLGNHLAEGTRNLSEKWGNDTGDFAMHVKGMEVSAYDSRAATAMLLSYMTCDVGAHHNRSWAITKDIDMGRERLEGKAEVVIDLQHRRPLLDMLGVCRFPWVEINLNFEYYAKFYTAVTGEKRTTLDLLRDSERVWNLTRCFWIRENQEFNRDYDMPPRRWLTPLTCEDDPTGGYCLEEKDVNRLLDRYYTLRGWGRDGRPTRETLINLGLEEIAESLHL